MKRGAWAELAVAGREFHLKVTPGARRQLLEQVGEGFRVQVTAAPEDGKANAAVTKLLAKALGVAKTRLVLLRGQSARDKVFRLE